jgi:negative regulator of replication initiation
VLVATTTATASAATTATAISTGTSTTTSAATALERGAAATTAAAPLELSASTATTHTGQAALDILRRLLNGALSAAATRTKATTLTAAGAKAALAFAAATEVLTLRHHLLARGQSHHALLNRTFEIALHVPRQLLNITGNLTARTISILDPLLATRIRATVEAGTLLAGATTQ